MKKYRLKIELDLDKDIVEEDMKKHNILSIGELREKMKDELRDILQGGEKIVTYLLYEIED